MGCNQAPVVSLDAPDVEALKAEDEAEGKEVPWRFAYAFNVTVTPSTHGIWEDLGDGRQTWRLSLHSAGAVSLHAVFSAFVLPRSGVLHIVGRDHSYLGGFTAANNKAHGKFSTSPLPGNKVTIEYTVRRDEVAATQLAISKVLYGYRPLGDFRSSGECNINVACTPAEKHENSVRSAAMILTDSTTRLCSGAMINNAANDGRQLFLTAHHCTQGMDPETWILWFRYQSTTCPFKSETDGPTKYSAQGLKLLATTEYSDFALLEVEEKIPVAYDVFLSGWNRENTPPVTPYVIHHPSGDVKKFTSTNATAESSDYFVPGTSHWFITNWSEGTTEPGSSGSPLFDLKERIVGQLHGGYARCDYNFEDYFGKLAVSWDHEPGSGTSLKPHLDPDGSGVQFINGRDLHKQGDVLA